MSFQVNLVLLVSIYFCIVLAFPSLPTTDECDRDSTPLCKLRHCKKWYTKNAEHHEFIELSSQSTTNLLLEFYVIGSSDCHVHLSPVVNPNRAHHAMYDFLIGTFNNSRTLVRHGHMILRDTKTANVLSESEPVQIRIETSPNGAIHIYRDNLLLLETIDRRLAPVRYVKFATDHAKGMNIYYNCSDDESSTELSAEPIADSDAESSISPPSSTSSSSQKLKSYLRIFTLLLFCLHSTLLR